MPFGLLYIETNIHGNFNESSRLNSQSTQINAVCDQNASSSDGASLTPVCTGISYHLLFGGQRWLSNQAIGCIIFLLVLVVRAIEYVYGSVFVHNNVHSLSLYFVVSLHFYSIAFILAATQNSNALCIEGQQKQK